MQALNVSTGEFSKKTLKIASAWNDRATALAAERQRIQAESAAYSRAISLYQIGQTLPVPPKPFTPADELALLAREAALIAEKKQIWVEYCKPDLLAIIAEKDAALAARVEEVNASGIKLRGQVLDRLDDQCVTMRVDLQALRTRAHGSGLTPQEERRAAELVELIRGSAPPKLALP